MTILVWHDDIRPAPEGWTWARTNEEAIRLLTENDMAGISLDHDLGLDHFTQEQIDADPELLFGHGQSEQTGYHLVEWMIENDRVPPKVAIHSWNPDGAKAMAARLNRFGYDCLVVPYSAPKR